MKKYFYLTIAISSWLTCVFSQNVQVPSVIKENFDDSFPNAENPIWDIKEGNYVVDFIQKSKHIVMFSKEGFWLKSEIFITEDELPDQAYEYIVNRFSEYEITLVQWIELDDGESYYLVKLNASNKQYTLKFKDSGEFY